MSTTSTHLYIDEYVEATESWDSLMTEYESGLEASAMEALGDQTKRAIEIQKEHAKKSRELMAKANAEIRDSNFDDAMKTLDEAKKYLKKTEAELASMEDSVSENIYSFCKAYSVSLITAAVSILGSIIIGAVAGAKRKKRAEAAIAKVNSDRAAAIAKNDKEFADVAGKDFMDTGFGKGPERHMKHRSNRDKIDRDANAAIGGIHVDAMAKTAKQAAAVTGITYIATMAAAIAESIKARKAMGNATVEDMARSRTNSGNVFIRQTCALINSQMRFCDKTIQSLHDMKKDATPDRPVQYIDTY